MGILLYFYISDKRGFSEGFQAAGQFTLPTDSPDQQITTYGTSGRYIRVRPSLTSGDGYLNIREIIVLDANNTNLALGMPVYATSTFPTFKPASSVVDGNTTQGSDINYWMSGLNNTTEFIEIDLGTSQNISSIRIIGASNPVSSLVLQNINAPPPSFIQYDPSIVYQFGDIVKYTDNNIYMMINPQGPNARGFYFTPLYSAYWYLLGSVSAAADKLSQYSFNNSTLAVFNILPYSPINQYNVGDKVVYFDNVYSCKAVILAQADTYSAGKVPAKPSSPQGTWLTQNSSWLLKGTVSQIIRQNSGSGDIASSGSTATNRMNGVRVEINAACDSIEAKTFYNQQYLSNSQLSDSNAYVLSYSSTVGAGSSGSTIAGWSPIRDSTDRLTYQQKLPIGAELLSTRGQYALLFGTDHVLYLYKKKTPFTILWSYNTGSTSSYLFHQGDINVFNTDSSKGTSPFIKSTGIGSWITGSSVQGSDSIWYTTVGSSKYSINSSYLQVLDNGNLVIYSGDGVMLFQTNTAKPNIPVCVPATSNYNFQPSDCFSLGTALDSFKTRIDALTASGSTIEINSIKQLQCNLQQYYSNANCRNYLLNTSSNVPQTTVLTPPNVTIKGGLTMATNYITTTGDLTSYVNPGDMIYLGYGSDIQGPFIVKSATSTQINITKNYIGANITQAVISITPMLQTMPTDAVKMSLSPIDVNAAIYPGQSYIAIDLMNSGTSSTGDTPVNIELGELVYIIADSCNVGDIDNGDGTCTSYVCPIGSKDTGNNMCTPYRCGQTDTAAKLYGLSYTTYEMNDKITSGSTYTTVNDINNNDGTCTTASKYRQCAGGYDLYWITSQSTMYCISTDPVKLSSGWAWANKIAQVPNTPGYLYIIYDKGIPGTPFTKNASNGGIPYKYKKSFGPFIVAMKPSSNKILIKSFTTGDLDNNGAFISNPTSKWRNSVDVWARYKMDAYYDLPKNIWTTQAGNLLPLSSYHTNNPTPFNDFNEAASWCAATQDCTGITQSLAGTFTLGRSTTIQPTITNEVAWLKGVAPQTPNPIHDQPIPVQDNTVNLNALPENGITRAKLRKPIYLNGIFNGSYASLTSGTNAGNIIITENSLKITSQTGETQSTINIKDITLLIGLVYIIKVTVKASAACRIQLESAAGMPYSAERATWTTETPGYLPTDYNPPKAYKSLDGAKKICEVLSDCLGVTHTTQNTYNLRKGGTITTSTSGETSWKKSASTSVNSFNVTTSFTSFTWTIVAKTSNPNFRIFKSNTSAIDLEFNNLTITGGMINGDKPGPLNILTSTNTGILSSTAVGSTVLSCQPGYYTNTSGVCEVCPAGKYSTEITLLFSPLCVSCPIGTYSNTLGATSCVPCAIGEKTSTVGATSCSPVCPRDWYMSNDGNSSCIKCPNIAPGVFTCTAAAGSISVSQCSGSNCTTVGYNGIRYRYPSDKTHAQAFMAVLGGQYISYSDNYYVKLI